MKTEKILTEFVNSKELVAYLFNSRTCARSLENWAFTQTNAIAECAKMVCQQYDIRRAEYNNVGGNCTVFIVPQVRINDSNAHTYLTFRWAQFQNGTYQNIPNQEDTWDIREIKRKGKNHFSEYDFVRALKHKCGDFIPIILETEHCMRFCREQYRRVKLIYSLERKLAHREPLSALAVSDLDDLDDDEMEIAEHTKKQAARGIFLTDPLCVSKKSSLFDEFYKLPEFHQEEMYEKYSMDLEEEIDLTF